MQAIIRQSGRSVDYTPGSAVSAGDVVVNGDLVGVATRDIAASTLGALTVQGVADVVQAAVTASIGCAMYWDTDGNPVGGTAGSGAATTVSTGNKFMGFSIQVTVGTDATCRILLMSTDSTALTSQSIGSLADVAKEGALSLTAGKILVADGDSLETVAVSGDATISSAGAVTLNAAHAQQVYMVPIAALAANADLSSALVWATPRAGTLTNISYLALGTDFGTIDDADTSVFAVVDGADNAIVSKTYNTATQPTANALNDLGALDGTNKALTAGEGIKLAITNGATAKTVAGYLVITFDPTNA